MLVAPRKPGLASFVIDNNRENADIFGEAPRGY
jgi:hypothetical protein